MKKITLLLLSIILIGCSKDDDNVNSSSLTGKYTISDIILNDGVVLDLKECKQEEYLLFTDTNKVLWHTPEDDEMESPCSFLDIEMTYEISGNIVYATYNNTTITIELSESSSNTLKIKSNNWTAIFYK